MPTVTRNLKKRIPTPNQAKSITSKSTETASKKADATAVKKKPVTPKKLPKTKSKGEVDHGKKEVEKKQPSKPAETGKSAKASKPIVASERKSQPTEPRPTDTREDFERHEEQLTAERMRELSVSAKKELFKKLNKKSLESQFITMLKPSEIPKKNYMRLKEAQIRKIIGDRPTKDALYCAYCIDWQPFQLHAWTGYKKCCGCGISTKDFHVACDNGLFGKEG